jgi:hypothetical protein
MMRRDASEPPASQEQMNEKEKMATEPTWFEKNHAERKQRKQLCNSANVGLYGVG